MIGEVHHLGHAELAARLTAAGQRVDALIVDAPYSERTHAAHNEASESDGERRSLAYSSWGREDVAEFADCWSPLVAGWLLSITDTALAPVWTAELERIGRYVFSPVACVQPGSRVRLMGDGPAQWSTWLIASRPRTSDFARWGALPGAYVVPTGQAGGHSGVVGGKPLWLMRALVRDYSRPNEIVCDPCAGASTTLLAAKLEGRRYVGGDIDAAHVALSRERLRDLPAADRKGTLALFGDR